MGRARTGTWKRSGDQFMVYVTLPLDLIPNRKERRLPGIPVPLTVGGRPTTEADLDKLAKLYTERPDLAISRLAELGRVPPWIPIEMVPRDALARGAAANPVAAASAGSLLETTAAYAERWIEWRDKQGMASIRPYRSGLRLHVLNVKVGESVIGEKPLAALTREDAKVVAASIRDERAAGKLTDSTATRYWSYFRTMLAMASDEDGDPALFVRSDNPCLGVKGPPAAKKQTRACFYPDEFIQFVSCEVIPLHARRIAALSVYLLCRLGELARLRCEDVDLVHETITIRRSFDTYRKKEKAPKNGKPRTFTLEPNVIPLLRKMIEEVGGQGRICPPNTFAVPRQLSNFLTRAGLHRPELRERSRTHLHITFHGLRATGATWAARSGRRTPHELRRMMGHTKQDTTDVYFDEAQLMGRNVGEVFPPLPPCLL